MANKFLIQNLDSITIPLSSNNYTIVESTNSSSTYKVDMQSLYKDVLSNRLVLSASRSSMHGSPNILSISFKNDDGTIIPLHQQSLQDGILSCINFTSATNKLSLYFNVSSDMYANASAEVNLNSLKDIYNAGYELDLSSNADGSQCFYVNITSDLSLNNYKIINVANPTANLDATNKAYVDSISSTLSNVLSHYTDTKTAELYNIISELCDTVTKLCTMLTSE